MPELPEVEAVCRQIETAITGSTIMTFRIELAKIIRQGSLDLLTRQTIQAVKRIGKFIAIELTGDYLLTVHLRMTGQLLWEPPEKLRDRYVRCVIETDRGSIYYRDVRTLGGLWITPAGQPPWKNIGVDPFAGEFNQSYLQNRFGSRAIAVKQLLLDQTMIAGIGNIYASEILFQAGINPKTPGRLLSKTDISKLHHSILDVLNHAVAAKGTTFRDFLLSNGREGDFHEFLRVYGHKNDPCPNCSHSIERIVQAGRSSFYCPVCQPENSH